MPSRRCCGCRRTAVCRSATVTWRPVDAAAAACASRRQLAIAVSGSRIRAASQLAGRRVSRPAPPTAPAARRARTCVGPDRRARPRTCQPGAAARARRRPAAAARRRCLGRRPPRSTRPQPGQQQPSRRTGSLGVASRAPGRARAATARATVAVIRPRRSAGRPGGPARSSAAPCRRRLAQPGGGDPLGLGATAASRRAAAPPWRSGAPGRRRPAPAAAGRAATGPLSAGSASGTVRPSGCQQQPQRGEARVAPGDVVVQAAEARPRAAGRPPPTRPRRRSPRSLAGRPRAPAPAGLERPSASLCRSTSARARRQPQADRRPAARWAGSGSPADRQQASVGLAAGSRGVAQDQPGTPPAGRCRGPAAAGWRRRSAGGHGATASSASAGR